MREHPPFIFYQPTKQIKTTPIGGASMRILATKANFLQLVCQMRAAVTAAAVIHKPTMAHKNFAITPVNSRHPRASERGLFS